MEKVHYISFLIFPCLSVILNIIYKSINEMTFSILTKTGPEIFIIETPKLFFQYYVSSNVYN